MSSSPVIELSGLGKRYEIYETPRDRLKQMVMPRARRLAAMAPRAYFREFWALRDIDLVVRRGETVGIIGQNGSGKSTLLQVICGTLYPTLGTVATNGRIAALLELGAGFNPEFSGKENVFLSGMLYGLTEAELRQRYDSIIAFADIGEFISQPVKTYSSGMYVRLAFSIAAHVDADVLVIDEALSVGDVRFTQKCMRFLRDFQKTGTLLFVSHDVGAVTALCTRAVWMHGGHKRMDGGTRDVVEAYLAEQHAVDRGELGDQVLVSGAAAVPVASAAKRGTAGGDDRGVSVQEPAQESAPRPDDGPDFRSAEAGRLGLRNRFEVYQFDAESNAREFGARGALIEAVFLSGARGEQANLLEGGEVVTLNFRVRLVRPLANLIAGFYVKDSLGQRLFGDNTHLAQHDRPVSGDTGESLSASFEFRMPVLPLGTYTVDVAVASGTQDDHTQQHWIHDALEFRATESTMRHGLVGIPMRAVALTRTSDMNGDEHP